MFHGMSAVFHRVPEVSFPAKVGSVPRPPRRKDRKSPWLTFVFHCSFVLEARHLGVCREEPEEKALTFFTS